MSQRTWLRRKLQQTGLREMVTRFHHRGIRDADVFLAAYPKSGMTWLRNLLAAYFLGSADAWMDDIRRVSFRVGRHQSLASYLPSGGRLINTHEPYRPEYRRSVLLIRDGRDVAVSEYNFWRHRYQDKQFSEVEFSDFLRRFLDGKTNGYGAWHKHVWSWLESPIHLSDTMLIVRYERLREETGQQLKRILQFLEVTPDEEKIRTAIERSSVERMRNAESTRPKARVKGPFVRNAKMGSWVDVFSENDLDAFMNLAGATVRSVEALAE